MKQISLFVQLMMNKSCSGFHIKVTVKAGEAKLEPN
jgi:hypothetical protein